MGEGLWDIDGGEGMWMGVEKRTEGGMRRMNTWARAIHYGWSGVEWFLSEFGYQSLLLMYLVYIVK